MGHFYEPAVGVRFMEGMAARGIVWHPLVANVMYSHTEQDIDRVLDAASSVVRCR
jgi:glutamate-1-semialdehyde aminotransferase